MSFRYVAAAAAALSLTMPAVAQTANEAFECKLPYRATMEAAAKLQGLKQGNPMNMGIVTTTVVDWNPGATRVFGFVPARTSLVMSEPDDSAKPARMSFQAGFPRTPAMESALLSAVKWKAPCGTALGICHRETDLPGTGKLDLRLDKDELWLDCTFEIREQDLQ